MHLVGLCYASVSRCTVHRMWSSFPLQCESLQLWRHCIPSSSVHRQHITVSTVTSLHPKQQCTQAAHYCIKSEALTKTTRGFLEDKTLACNTDTHERAQCISGIHKGLVWHFEFPRRQDWSLLSEKGSNWNSGSTYLPNYYQCAMNSIYPCPNCFKQFLTTTTFAGEHRTHFVRLGAIYKYSWVVSSERNVGLQHKT